MTTRWKCRPLARAGAALSAAVLVFLPVQSFSAPGTLSNVPLFLDSAALPNIFFMIDDSGSMDADLTTPAGALTGVGGSEGLMPIDAGGGAYYGYMYATYASDNVYTYPGTWGGVVPTQESVDAAAKTDAWASMTGVWRARNKDYNKTYYDPSVTYEPWSGVDSSGNAYADATYTSVYTDPYDKTGSVNLSITQSVDTRVPDVANSGQTNFTFSYMPMRYWEWTDSNGNGEVDAADSHVLIEITSGKSACATGTPGSSSGACLVRDYADEAQNFANWWQYHRRREYAMKASVGSVVAGTNSVRMGISTLHATSSEQMEVSEINNDVTSGNKKSLMDTIFSIHSSGGTPLLQGLIDSGDYYDCTGADPFGFSTDCPVETTAVSPATEAAGVCQQNFTILFTDGYYTDSTSSYGNADGAVGGSSWTDGGVTYKFDEGPYGDTVSNTLADVAMHYYERDLNSGLDNKVPTQCGVDENPGQHMVTYTVGFGVSGSLTNADLPSNPKHPNYAYDASDSTCTATPTTSTPTWPSSISSNADKIDDLLHAAYNGRGEYYSANNSATLAASIQSAINDVLSRTGSASAVAFNSTTLGTDTHAYLALFDSARWSGDLISYPLDPTTGAISATEDWKAATKLSTVSPSNRVILTSSSSDGIPFTWSAISTLLATDVIRTDLEYNSGNGEKRLDYLRGDSSNEGTGENYRIRTSRLGDIVHSTPVFVGSPDVGWPDAAPFPTASPNRYSDFKAAQLASPREKMIYVGANDGMLHGFAASDGTEKLGYIPRVLYSSGASEGLHYLTDPAYGHRYYVDMTPAVSDAYIKTTTSGSVSWHTVLVGSLGAGGRGIFALDVTDPSKFSESTSPSNNPADVVMWEFTSSDDDDLGYTYSEPVIALTNTVSGGANRWAAIFGNGYNSTNGVAKLFVVFLDGGINGSWMAGTDYIEITTGTGSSGSKNGLSAPAVIDTDGNGTADRVYSGDLQGNMWVFDLSNSSTGSWGSAYKSGSTPVALFTGNSDQPITTTPIVADHPTESSSGSNQPNLMVYFGTGQYLTDSDISTTTMQSYYGVWDEGSSQLSRSNLVEQGLASGITGNGGSFRILTDNAVGYNLSGISKQFGWFIDFDPSSTALGDSGERVVVNSTLRGDHIFFNTIVPSPNPCTAGGWGWMMAVKSVNGGQPDAPVFDFNNDGVVDANDVESVSGDVPSGTKHSQGMPSESSFLGNKQYTTDTTTEKGTDVDQRQIEELEGPNTGRFSWEELLNF
ncbi:pilus assembly protein [Sedimenticola hydrogenitrophicus]|uniref:pilus assembly protein n=1 Tax=Sedimenticola hydrogenitrophicus TaxID=2967975 RepID=UPI0021A54045|nr:PilC/PilY family type IV pilus protein [Sedimenticola hydrogenitrophicus]